MYEYFTGVLTKITPTYIVLDVAGVGYLLQVANPYAWSDQLNQTVTIHVHHVVREDAQLLYGFKDESEKAVFLKLISVSGIGPKSALAIVAADDNDGLVAAIDSNNVTYLTKFPGVGKKTASQMILDLAGKFDFALTNSENAPTAKTPSNVALEEAMAALQALGYSAREVAKVEKVLATQDLSTEAYVKAGLKALMN